MAEVKGCNRLSPVRSLAPKSGPLRTGPAKGRRPVLCPVHLPRSVSFPEFLAVQKFGTRAPSHKGRKLNGCTRSLRAAALPFPSALSLIPVRPFCPHGEELRETSNKPHGRHNMSKLNVNTPASESKESSFLTAKPSEEISYEAIRRALRRSLFFKDHPQFNVNTAALRSDFAMNLEYLTAATFTREEADFNTGKFRSGIEMLLINAHEKLQITVFVYAPAAGSAPEIYETRIVHSANPIGEEEYAENTEYQTTNVYKATGELNVAALDLFWSEHEGLIKYAKQNLPRTNEYSPFCHWQFSHLRG
ncbi:hypothetical protein [Pantoea vagans]|uniref:hypothetical protein n=1 Tax=Pantoea vagans TaxID=470934 RepID=UPI000F4F92FE|nr:hypothetical protein [Pantoea vagans]